MKGYFLLTLFVIFITSATMAQKVSNVNFSQRNQQIEIKYDLTGYKFNEYFSIAVYASKDGGRTYSGPLKEVSGDVGLNIQGGKNRTIVWNVFKEIQDFEGNVKFDVRATVFEQKIGHHLFFGYKGTQSAPIGFTAGITGRPGFYLSARLNPDFFLKAPYKTDGITVLNYDQSGYYSFLASQKTQRMSITAGIQYQLNWVIHLYAGAGYSRYNLLWQIEQFDYPNTRTGTQWVKHTGESFNDFEVEGGISFQFKHFFACIGISFPGLQLLDLSIGGGYLF